MRRGGVLKCKVVTSEGIELSEIELREKSRQLEDLVPIVVKALPDGFDSKTAYLALENGWNVLDGRVVRFVNSTYGKIIRHKGYDTTRIIPQLKEIFDASIPIGFQPERPQPVRPDGTIHKKHPNFVGYHNYLGKIVDSDVVYYVRFTIQEERTRNKDYIPNSVHSTFVSNVEIYKTDGSLSRSTTSVGERENSVGFDKIVAQFLLACKGGA